MARGIIGACRLTAERLRELYVLDWATGTFTPLQRPRAKVGTPTSKGYISIFIDGRTYVAHRLVWLYVTGSWPPNKIDHRNRNKADNRPSNLRCATDTENAANRKVRKDNRLGLKGVTMRTLGRYEARLQKNGKKAFLGSFDCPAAAHFAYLLEASKRFGEFARAA